MHRYRVTAKRVLLRSCQLDNDFRGTVWKPGVTKTETRHECYLFAAGCISLLQMLTNVARKLTNATLPETGNVRTQLEATCACAKLVMKAKMMNARVSTVFPKPFCGTLTNAVMPE